MAKGLFVSAGLILQKYAQQIIDGLKKNLEESKHIASYKLLQSISVNVEVFGTQYSIVISMEDYWKYVEFGRKDGKQPPPEAVLKWTVQKGFSMNEVAAQLKARAEALRRSKGIKRRAGLNRPRKKIDREQTRKQLAFLIGRKIGKKGIPPSGFASKTLGKPLVEQGIAQGVILDKLESELTETMGREIELQIALRPF